MEMGLVDLAVQAVDGSKIQGNTPRNCTFDAVGLQKLLDRTEVAIAELEAQNEGGDGPPPPRLHEKLGFFHSANYDLTCHLTSRNESTQAPALPRYTGHSGGASATDRPANPVRRMVRMRVYSDVSWSPMESVGLMRKSN